jgi:hypothetical protein
VDQVGKVAGCIEAVKEEMASSVQEWLLRDGLKRRALDELVGTIDPEKDKLLHDKRKYVTQLS